MQSLDLSDDDEDLSLTHKALAGGVAGIFSSTAICPAEVVKCRLQVLQSGGGNGGNSKIKMSPMRVAVDVVRADGLLGLFRGLPSLWMRDIPFNFVFIGSYEVREWGGKGKGSERERAWELE